MILLTKYYNHESIAANLIQYEEKLNVPLGNIHIWRPIFGMVGWSGKKGQNGTTRVGWLNKKGCPIFHSIIRETIPAFLPHDFSIEKFEYDLY